MGNEHHARCNWCGTTAGIDWTSSSVNYSIYCSGECKRAGELMNWVCASVLTVPITIYLWALGVNWHGYGFDIFLSILLLFSFSSLVNLTLIYRGIKARSQTPENSRLS